jgi:hypothetical protein
MEHILGNDMVAQHGTAWYYSCGDVNVWGDNQKSYCVRAQDL